MTHDDRGKKIEVTPAMIEAGALELIAYDPENEPRSEAVVRVFESMAEAAGFKVSLSDAKAAKVAR